MSYRFKFDEEHWELDCSPLERESDLNKYIERKRQEYREEWYEYIKEWNDDYFFNDIKLKI